MSPHPTILILAIILVSSIVVSFTPPDSRVIRLGALLFIMIRSSWASLVGGYSVTLFFHYIDIALLGQWSFHRQPFLEKFALGLSLAINARFSGTSQQVKGVTLPETTLSRRCFLWRTARLIFLSYITLDIMDSSADPDMIRKYLSPLNVPLFRRLYYDTISGEEIKMRFLSVLGAGIGLVAVQGGCHQIFAFLSVLLHLSEPSDWPPLYGSISDAYTLRRFWSLSWHQLNRHKLDSISRYVVHDISNIPRGKRTAFIGLAKIVLAFATSGLMHLLIDMSTGLSVHTSGAVSFFSIQILGIIAENTALMLCHQAMSYNRLPSTMQKCIGYIWVFMFLVWTVPAYMYPIMSLSDSVADNAVVPLSVVDLLR
ncbi:membrane bound O-acyl transferase family-domain-containing protein [Aspergillus similis]